MIKGIASNNPYISIRSSHPEYFNMSTPSAGMMRYNGNLSCVEIYDGSFWRTVNNFDEIGLTPQANEILDWAKKKMQEEQEIKNIAIKNNAVQAAFDAFKEAEKILKITTHLAKQNDISTTN